MDKDNIQTVKKFNQVETGNLVSYKITTTDGVIMYAPVNDNENTEYKTVQEWAVVDGNTIAEAD
jgi:hypothetical protein|tara:strand:+ start:375 stop:566 length:192 start_codon:yes stop_codon:yes gene_type:complete